ncbi:MAG: nicotinate-nucleotide--dimethylbenzimidazole phosphoribosyltransferase [Thiotrichaceae bacterium]|nr:nicotinate-nucleotide--dimethylbenzimidazole phosphoribosyltransferase [Thiotrichaceae bacterium]
MPTIQWIDQTLPLLDLKFKQQAIEHQNQLTKPAGSLGRLEDIAIQMAHLQQTKHPSADNIFIAIFAADHGVAEENVSAFPQEVTTQMVSNFLHGGAAINVLAKQLNAHLEIIDVGIKTPLNAPDKLIEQRIAKGTKNSTQHPAMSEEQLRLALNAGFDSATRAKKQNAQLYIGGEMGIANTTSASALYCALLNLTPTQVTGAGTGLNEQAIASKTQVVQQILAQHQSHCGSDPLKWLQCVGGFEIVALCGAYLHAAQRGIPILVDGFISSVAALYAQHIQPDISEWLFYSHLSAEQGHLITLNTKSNKPLIDLGLRLGEASGAALAAPLLRTACALHNEMATFTEAAVAGTH